MNNKFCIGDRVLRISTDTAHVVEDIRTAENINTMTPDGRFDVFSGYAYTISEVPFNWIIEPALAKIDDDEFFEKSKQKRKELET